MPDWQTLAREKRDSVNALIPKAWLLSSIPSAAEQRDVTGKYIQQFLTEREVEITETDAVGIVKHTTTGAWKAKEVAEAFCHRAALAHQLVWIAVLWAQTLIFNAQFRLIVYMKYFSRLQLQMPKN